MILQGFWCFLFLQLNIKQSGSQFSHCMLCKTVKNPMQRLQKVSPLGQLTSWVVGTDVSSWVPTHPSAMKVICGSEGSLRSHVLKNLCQNSCSLLGSHGYHLKPEKVFPSWSYKKSLCVLLKHFLQARFDASHYIRAPVLLSSCLFPRSKTRLVSNEVW